jgi:hypothetical protein
MYAVGVKLLIHQSELRTYTKEVLSLCCVLKNIKCNDITKIGNVRSMYMDYIEPFGCILILYGGLLYDLCILKFPGITLLFLE